MGDSVKTGRPLLQDVIGTCSRLHIPVQAVLELTYHCNLRCSHCYVDFEENDELTFAEWKDVLKQLKAAGTIYLLFTGGEITTRPDFIHIAQYARRNGFIPGFLTNGTLLTPGICREIADLKPFSLGISLYGATAATHESVTGVPGSFKRTLAGIRYLVSTGVLPTVQTLVMKNNLAELPRIKELVASLGAKFRINSSIAPSKSGSTIPLQYEPSLKELGRFSWWQESFQPDECAGPGLCKAGRAMCSVSPSGNVFPCVMFPLKLGNLRKSSFDTIWRMEPIAELRCLRSMTLSALHSCNTCHLRKYCQRCTGVAYLESGSVGGPSPSACQQAQTHWQLSQTREVKLCAKNPI